MPQIDSVEFGTIVIGGQKYHQVLIVGSEVKERNRERLEGLFGTTHRLGEWEIERLLKEEPEVIVVGHGFDGRLEVDEDLAQRAREQGILVMVLSTLEAVRYYNDQSKQGKKVNALIHTTC